MFLSRFQRFVSLNPLIFEAKVLSITRRYLYQLQLLLKAQDELVFGLDEFHRRRGGTGFLDARASKKGWRGTVSREVGRRGGEQSGGEGAAA